MSLFHCNGVSAVGRRQLSSFLGNPLGYVFILAFVLVSGAVLFWLDEDRFFARNIADLGPLTQNDTMGWLLCVLLPALGMGAWAAERDHGTEEHLLTLPLSPLDALLGKWLAVAVFFTIALACTLSHVGVIAWLGTPDWGLVACNYAGWWLAGLAFAGIAVLASTLVSMPAVAFVIGVVGCAAAMWSLHTWEWFDGFNRGVISLGAVVTALAIAAGALGAATFILSSRRWRPGSEATVVAQVMSLICAIVLVANLSRLAARGGIDADATAEGLSSVSAASLAAVRGLEQPVTITAFISKDVPPELALKAKEVEDKLKALGRASPTTVVVQLLRPADALDDDGVKAEREFNLKPRRQVINAAAGRHFQDVFLGAAVTSAGRTQVIEHFDPGLSVEYELVRAVRSVSGAKKRVLGIATTDLEITGGFDYRTMGMTQAWEIVEEWKRQYEVRTISLDGEVASDVEVLVVPQPSTLTAAQIERLHDYIWAGRPALLLEDPMPFFQVAQGRSDLIPGQPKRNPGAQFGGQPPDGGPQKGDLRPLIKALGLEFRPEETVWSDFNPSHYFKELIPANFVWLTADRGAIEPKNAATTGVNALLLPYPGSLNVASEKASTLTATSLLMPVSGPAWGVSFMRELTSQNPYNGQLQLNPPDKLRRRPYADQNKRPPFAIEVTGVMPSAFPRLPAGAKPAAPAKEGEAAKDAPKPTTGTPSAKPVHVIVVADLDLIDNEFFQFYRNAGNRLGAQDELRVLLDLKNVQFVANAVDALFDDKAYLELRTRRPARRPLTRLEAVTLAAQETRNQQRDAAQDAAQAKIDALNAKFTASLAKIDAREDLDEDTKAQARSTAQVVGQRELENEIQAITLKRQQEERTLGIEQDRAVRDHRWWVKFLAISIPTAVLALIAICVFANRLFSERTHIPAARRRQGA